MNSHDTMQRLRAARPATATSSHDDTLFARIVSEPGDPRLTRSRARRVRLTALDRPRLLAGGSLAIAGICGAVILAISGGDPAPAFAVTREADGDVLVTLSNTQAIVYADEQLVSKGVNEQVDYRLAPGAATSSAPVACKLVLGPGDHTAASSAAGPPVDMRLGDDNTGTVPAGTSGSGSLSGTVHLASCVSYPAGPGTELGNSGQAFLNANGGA